MDKDVTKSTLFFESNGVKCAADFYLPTGAAEKSPCIVMAHGFSATKDSFGMPAFAGSFAEGGFAVLAFDYRNFGESGGVPRQVIHIPRQREDFHAAIRFARSLDNIDPDRIILWGSSLSGGHVVDVAAKDPEIAAVIAQVPFLDAFKGKGSEKAPANIQLKLLSAALRDAVHGLLGLPPHLIPVVGNPGEFATMTEQEAKPVAGATAEGTTWRNEFAPRIAFGMPRYKDGTAECLNMPVLFCIAEQDVQASPAFTMEIAKRIPKGEVRIYPVGHFGLYTGEMRDRVISDQLKFLGRALGISTSLSNR